MSYKLGVIWHGPEISALIKRQIQVNLLKCGMDLLSESVKEAPKDTGDLRGNCTVDESKLDQLEITVGYSLPYARIQHENLNFRHTDGKAKFLEDPYNRQKDKYKRLIGSVRL